MAYTPPKITISHASSVDTSSGVASVKIADIPPSQHVLTTAVPAIFPAQLQELRKGIDYNNLEDLLRKYAIPHEDANTRNFWPSSLLNDLMTLVRIHEELEDIRDEHRDLQAELNANLADEIHLGYRKIFAILCILDKGHLIVDFIEEGVKDSDLPLVDCVNTKPTDYELARKAAPTRSLACIKRLKSRHNRESFSRIQHRFNPAFLSLGIDSKSGRRDIRHEQYEPTLILPIEQRVRKDQGGYGMVSRVRINPRCHEFQNILGTVSVVDVPESMFRRLTVFHR